MNEVQLQNNRQWRLTFAGTDWENWGPTTTGRYPVTFILIHGIFAYGGDIYVHKGRRQSEDDRY